MRGRLKYLLGFSTFSALCMIVELIYASMGGGAVFPREKFGFRRYSHDSQVDECMGLVSAKDGIMAEWMESLRGVAVPNRSKLYFTPWKGTANKTLYERPRIYWSVDELDPNRKYLKWSQRATKEWGISNKYFFLVEYMYLAKVLNRTLLLPADCLDRSMPNHTQCAGPSCGLFTEINGLKAFPMEIMLDVTNPENRDVVFLATDAFLTMKATRPPHRHIVNQLVDPREPPVLVDSVAFMATDGEYLDYCRYSDFYYMSWIHPMRVVKAKEDDVIGLKELWGNHGGWLLGGLDEEKFLRSPNRIRFGSLEGFEQCVEIARKQTVPSRFVMDAAHWILANRWPGFAERGYGPKLCLHWRRGDFLEQSHGVVRDRWVEAVIWDGIDACHACEGEEGRDTLLITDEVEESELEKMRARNVTIMSDVFRELQMLSLPLLQHKNVQALISQVVCGSALGFAGLVSSSFSNRIANMRGDQLKSSFILDSHFEFDHLRDQPLRESCCEEVHQPRKIPRCDTDNMEERCN